MTDHGHRRVYAPKSAVAAYRQVPLTPDQLAADRLRIERALYTVTSRNSTPAVLYSALTGALGLDQSGISADMECEHGRLAGDPCPQPAWIEGGYGEPRRIPNPDYRWRHPYPCECWGEARVTATPDPFNGRVRATHTHDARRTPVGLPRVPV